MKGDLIVHVIHVAGNCMKELGIDGLYIGYFPEGVMSLKYHLEMLPRYVGAWDILGGIDKWIRNWWGCQPLIKLYHMG